MVGALADWFAVTALFRHPLGIPIPHTAIIPNRKDQIGRSLGRFVQDELPDAGRSSPSGCAAWRIGARLAEWLADPANARHASPGSAAVRGASLELLDDEVHGRIERHGRATRCGRSTLAPLLGARLDAGHRRRPPPASCSTHCSRRASTGFLRRAERRSCGSGSTSESPWWVPEPIDDRVFDRISPVVRRFLAARSAPTRPRDARDHVDERVRASPTICAPTRRWSQGRGAQGGAALPPRRAGVDRRRCGASSRRACRPGRRPRVDLRRRLERRARTFGQHGCATSSALQRKVDGWVARSPSCTWSTTTAARSAS